MALVKHNNNSISAVTSMASLSTGSMSLIKEVTASSDASISFVDGSSDVVLDSTYPIYKFEFINIHGATEDAEFQFQGSTDSGSNYNVTKTSTYFLAEHFANSASTSLGYQTAKDLAQSTSFQSLMHSLGNANDENLSGELYLYNPSSTTFVKHFVSRTQAQFYDPTNVSFDNHIAGYGNTTSAVDAIQFKMSSGNIDAGEILLFGVN